MKLGSSKYYYPKRLDVPKEEVLLKRKERKERKQQKQIVIKQKRRHRVYLPTNKNYITEQTKTYIQYKFKVPNSTMEKKCYKIQHPGLSFVSVAKQNHQEYQIDIQISRQDYLNQMWRLLQQSNQQTQSLLLNLFPNVKEQTESIGALQSLLYYQKDLSQTHAIVVGDGNTPRTGYLLAQKCKHVYSIDPIMKRQWIEDSTNSLPSNLKAYACRVEDFKEWSSSLLIEKIEHLAIVSVHAHVNYDVYLDELLTNVFANSPELSFICLIGIPCCIPYFLTDSLIAKYKFTIHPLYKNYSIISPRRTIHAWTWCKP